MHVRVRRRGEDEEADGHDAAAGDHEREPLFGDHDALVRARFLGEARLRVRDDDAGAHEDANQQADVREATDAQREAAHFAEGDRVGDEDEVEDAVDEGLVDGDEAEDRLRGEHDCEKKEAC